MGFHSKYLNRNTFCEQLFDNPKLTNLGMVVAIPAFVEKDLIESLESLDSCQLPEVGVEVIIIINHSETSAPEDKALNTRLFESATQWVSRKKRNLNYLISSPIELPKKHAGAGLARKIGMDEAVRRFEISDCIQNLIICFDADAKVAPNYLVSIWNHFQSHPNSLAISINFEHPLDSQNDFQNEAIMQYELHLRYYQAALVFADHPHAHFTVGSSMGVRLSAYVAEGGMNRRKAGEDFWFMLKLMLAGEISANTETTVYPSSRISERVPFGTGRAMLEMKQNDKPIYLTSPLSSFVKLKEIMSYVPLLYKEDMEFQDSVVQSFFDNQQYKEILKEIRSYTTSYESFEKRFYRWFNVFMVMKFFHFLRDEGVQDEPVLNEAMKLGQYFTDFEDGEGIKDVLIFFRHKKRVQSNDYTLP